MKTFHDTRGRLWTVEVTVRSIKRVRALLDLDLMEVLDGKLFQTLATDPILLADVLFVLIKPQADAAGVTDEEFGSSLGGDVLERATGIFLEELADFFPGPRRATLRAAVHRLRSIETRLQEEVLTRIDGPTVDQMVDDELAKFDAEISNRLDRNRLARDKPGSSSGNGPAPVASTHIH